MILMAGLGNPGAKYQNNRHNIGFMAAEAIHRRHRFAPWRQRFQGLCAEGAIGGEKVFLLMPGTFMNESGRAVGEHGLQMRHRRAAECRQVDPLQRADADRRGAGGELSVLHHRAERRRRRGARPAARQRSPRSQVAEIIPTRLTFVDIAGLVRGASKGEGLGNQFLANIREVDAIAHVLRCFEDSDITHVEGKIDPVADIETIETELMLADLDSLEKRIVNSRRRPRAATRKPRSRSI
jgi:hypothetical protein